MGSDQQIIAVVGGTGKLGTALARRWAKFGHTVIIGSRDMNRALSAANALSAEVGVEVRGDSNPAAARSAAIVVVTVPYANHEAILKEIAPDVTGKIVVDTTVPLVPPKVARVQLPSAGSAAVSGQMILGDDATVVSAFHNVAAHKLATDEPVACDVLVFGDSKAARGVVVGLVDDLGLRGLHGGPLVNSAAVEAMTSVLIFVNRFYAVDGAGIQITGNLIQPETVTP